MSNCIYHVLHPVALNVGDCLFAYVCVSVHYSETVRVFLPGLNYPIVSPFFETPSLKLKTLRIGRYRPVPVVFATLVAC